MFQPPRSRADEPRASKRAAKLAVGSSPDARVRRVMAELRGAIAAVLGAVPTMPTRAIDVARELQLDRSLGWKLHRVAFGEDELPSPQHVPGARGMAIFLDAAIGAGVSTAAVARAREAFTGFEGLVMDLGGDRATGDIVLSEFSVEGRRRRDLALRRALVRANSHLLGVQAKRMRQITLALPGPADHSPTFYQLRGVFGFRCLRDNAVWTLGRVMVVISEDRHPEVQELRSPLEPADAGSGAPLVRRFCVGDGELARRRTVAPGISEDEIVPASIGCAAERDIVLAERVASAPARLIADAVTTNIVTPMENLVIDLLLHRDLVGDAAPEVNVYTTVLGPTPWLDRTPRDRLPIETTLEALPTHARRLRRDPMLEYLLTKAGADASEFGAHRLEVRFPPVPCAIVMSFPVRKT